MTSKGNEPGRQTLNNVPVVSCCLFLSDGGWMESVVGMTTEERWKSISGEVRERRKGGAKKKGRLGLGRER